MAVFVVRFGAGRARRYLAQADGVGPGTGRRPFAWTKELGQAEKFASDRQARTFALESLGHSLWDVAVAPPRGLPTNDFGGTPAAIRRAA